MSHKLVTTFESFIKDIGEVFPEYKQRLTDYYQECFQENKDIKKINEFLDNIKSNHMHKNFL